jgi:hypothetical protein
MDGNTPLDKGSVHVMAQPRFRWSGLHPQHLKDIAQAVAWQADDFGFRPPTVLQNSGSAFTET